MVTVASLTREPGDGVSMMVVVNFSPDGERLLGAGEGARAEVRDIASGKPVAAAWGNDFYVAAAFSPDGTRFITAGFASKPRVSSVSVWAIPAKP